MDRGPNMLRETTEVLTVGKSQGRPLKGDRRNGNIFYLPLFKSLLGELTGPHRLLSLNGYLACLSYSFNTGSRTVLGISGLTQIAHRTRQGSPTANSFQTSTSEFQGQREPSLPHPPRFTGTLSELLPEELP